MLSLRKKEILTTGLSGLSLLILGFCFLFDFNKLILAFLLIFLIVTFVLSSYLIKKSKTDTLDELANHNFQLAQSVTSSLTNLLIVILIFLFLTFDFSITLNSANLSIFFGITLILKTLIFVALESSTSSL